MDKQREFQKRILATFKLEAEENVNSISSHLIELEKVPALVGNEQIFEELYRSAHSLKGAARAVGTGDIESLCHAFEDVLSAIRNEEIGITSNTVDVFFYVVDLMSDLLFEIENEISEELSFEVSNCVDMLTLVEVGEEVEIPKKKFPKKIQEEVKKEATVVLPETAIQPKTATRKTVKKKLQNTPASKQKKNDTIRISSKKLDSFLIQVEELLPLKLTAIQQAEDLQRMVNKFVYWKKEVSLIGSKNKKTISIENDSLVGKSGGEARKIIDFFELSKNRFNIIEKELYDLLDLAKQEAYSANQKIETLLEDVKELLTVPFSILLDGFPKMVRDIAKDLEKEVEFIVEGDNIEIDRRILEELRNPLTHLLRNSIDYGIEDPEIRIQKNKSRKGKITIKIEQIENNKVSLWIIDDGPGLNLDKLRKLYLEKEKNALDETEISESELSNYIFKSGISTSEMVTDISGRGLGMAIVQETIEQLGGSIQVKTKKDKGTTFQIILPLSIVTFRGVIIDVAGRNFIVPTFKVLRILQIKRSQIKTIKNRNVVQVNNEIIPLVSLAQTLEISVKGENKEKEIVIVFEIKGKRIGFIIDNVIGEQEVLVKNFNKQLTRVRNILGATVLGANQVVPVLNVADLYKSFANNSSISTGDRPKSKKESEAKSVLIVEDSITSRTLLKNIVEAAGYNTTVAVDGVDGFTKLKVGEFDAVISDVEMPRMNGFELTEKIRNDVHLANIPVILVTSLSKREHREKGVEVGANAYIMKGSFDQGNLLQALERLI